MSKYDSLEEFMKQTDVELHDWRRKMYFSSGEWIVLESASVSADYHLVDSFLDAVPGALKEALKCLHDQ